MDVTEHINYINAKIPFVKIILDIGALVRNSRVDEVVRINSWLQLIKVNNLVAV